MRTWTKLVGLAAVASLAFALTQRRRVPQLGLVATGDAALIDLIRATKLPGERLAVVLIDGDRVRSAHFASDAATPFEIGSITKGLTGLLIADAVDRGELGLDDQLAQHLPSLGGPIGRLSLRQLVTHRSGLPPLAPGVRETLRGLWWLISGANPYHGNLGALLATSARLRLGPDKFEYSNLGAALAGHAAAAAIGGSFAETMETRILAPLGMTATAVQDRSPLVSPGRNTSGRVQQPWVLDAFAPAGGVVSTSGDLTRLAQALLAGRVPGAAALRPIADTDQDDEIGFFWFVSPNPDGVGKYVWHNGGTGGYSSYLALDLERQRAVIVLSAVSDGATELGELLLTAGI